MTYTFIGKVKSLEVKTTKITDEKITYEYICSFICNPQVLNDDKHNKILAFDDIKLVNAKNESAEPPKASTITDNSFTANKEIFNFISQHSKEKLKITYDENVITSAELVYG